jgi:hypothetical protein
LKRTGTKAISKIDCAYRAAELVARFMNYRRLTVAVALIAVRLVVPFASAEPKAYDTVFYKGKTARLRILFEFGHGHVEASNVKITESASGKTTKFYLSGRDGQMGTGKMRFAPVKGAKKRGFVRDGSVWRSSVHYRGQLYGRRKNCSVHSYKKEEALNGSTAASSSRNAVSFSSARITKRFPPHKIALDHF